MILHVIYGLSAISSTLIYLTNLYVPLHNNNDQQLLQKTGSIPDGTMTHTRYNHMYTQSLTHELVS